MLKSFFINSIRNIRKHSGYTILNITGLTIGLTSFLLISLYVFHELSYDRFHGNHKNTYRIKVNGVMSGSTIDQAVTAAPMSAALLKDYPEIEHAVRLRKSGAFLVKRGDVSFNEDGILFADSSFFSVFDFRLLRGNPHTALVNPRSIILTEKFAEKYFGKEDPMGKTLSLEADTNLYTVTGVMQDIPSNSHFTFDMLASFITLRNSQSQQWVNHFLYTYIVLKDQASRASLEAKFPDMIKKYLGPEIKQVIGITLEDFLKAGNQFNYGLEPLRDIHLKGAPQYPIEPYGSLTNVYIFSVIALLVLAIAVINYINLATAKSAGRAKEVGIRKASGSGKAGLMIQFIGESVLLVSIAAILAVLLVLALTPMLSGLFGKEISISLFSGWKSIAALTGLILVTGIASGFYPAMVLSSYNPVDVLKGTMSPGSASKTFRGVLVVFQFAVSIVIMIGAFTIYRQLNYMVAADMGVDKQNLLVVRRPDVLGNQLDAFKEQVQKIAGVESAGNTLAIPGKLFSNNAFLIDEDPTKTTHLINQTFVSVGYAETMGIKLSSGRFFSRDYSDTLSIVINETAAKSLGFTDPLGKYLLQPANRSFTKYRIVGVMKDFNIASMHNRIPPVCFSFMSGKWEGYLCIRLTGKDVTGTIHKIESLWKEFNTKQPFQYTFFDEEFEKLYETEFKAGRIFVLFAVLAILIACLGLTGLITYMTTIRTREVGIRKTYGGTGFTVVYLFSKEVLSLIAISSLIAWPVAFFGIRSWLETFAEKTSVSPMVYIFSSIIGLTIGLSAIMYHALRAASTNPAEALRYK